MTRLRLVHSRDCCQTRSESAKAQQCFRFFSLSSIIRINSPATESFPPGYFGFSSAGLRLNFWIEVMIQLNKFHLTGSTNPSFPRKRDPVFLLGLNDRLPEIFPVWIPLFNQLQLPCPVPFFQLLFSCDRRHHVVVQFIVDELVNPVFLSETVE